MEHAFNNTPAFKDGDIREIQIREIKGKTENKEGKAYVTKKGDDFMVFHITLTSGERIFFTSFNYDDPVRSWSANESHSIKITERNGFTSFMPIPKPAERHPEAELFEDSPISEEESPEEITKMFEGLEG